MTQQLPETVAPPVIGRHRLAGRGRFPGRAARRRGLLGTGQQAAFALVIGPSGQWTTHWLPPALLTGVAIGLPLPVQSGAAVAALPDTRFGSRFRDTTPAFAFEETTHVDDHQHRSRNQHPRNE